MKTRLVVAGLLMAIAGTVMAQHFRVVRGNVIPKSSREWKVIRDRIEVDASTFHVLVCRTFKVEDIVGPGGRGVIVGKTTQKKTYLDIFVLTNYPGSGGFTKGSEIRGPVLAFPVGVVNMGGYRTPLELLDYGSDYVPPPPKPGAVKAAVASTDTKTAENPDCKLDPTSVATFKFHLQKAKDGIAGSQFRVAQLYLQGIGTQRDTNQAIVWLKKAKEQGNDEAGTELTNLGQ